MEQFLSRLAPILALTCGLAAGPALADTPCALADAAPVAAFDTLESAMFAGDFVKFFDRTAELGLGLSASDRDKAAGALGLIAAAGFDRCQVIVQRVDTGGTVQRISAFYIKGKDFPLFLYQVAVPDGKRLWLDKFNVQTDLSKITREMF